MKRMMIVRVLQILTLILALAVASMITLALWFQRPLPLPQDGLDLSVATGSPFAHVARDLAEKGVIAHPRLLTLAAKVRGITPQVEAGEYYLAPPMTIWELLDELAAGVTASHELTIIEGQTLRDLLENLEDTDSLKLKASPSVEQIANAIAIPAAQLEDLEGQFFPDTYFYAPGSDALGLLKQAHRKMQRELTATWEGRDSDLPYANPRELLIMASIIEKETNAAGDRAKVASVFVNRLRQGMRLQTDPTVIYGLGEAFDGNLTREHLRTDTPFNTYTRAGLPPSPIAMPGKAALEAAAHPATTPYIYFVSRGDGSSEFSITLAEHNAAVEKFQLKR